MASSSPYTAASNIAAFCPNLLDGASAFSASTLPTSTQLANWLQIGAVIIDNQLAAHGYGVPVASTVAAYDWLAQINTYYATAQAEKVRMNATVSPGERTRARLFEDQFWHDLNLLLDSDPAALGLTVVATRASIYAGGVSVTDKESVTDNDDNTKPRFSKNQFATWVND